MIIEMLNTSTYLVWLIAGVVLLAAELGTPGMFFFTSCSVGAFAGAWLGGEAEVHERAEYGPDLYAVVVW